MTIELVLTIILYGYTILLLCFVMVIFFPILDIFHINKRLINKFGEKKPKVEMLGSMAKFDAIKIEDN